MAASGVRNITIRGNRSYNNLSIGIFADQAYSVSVTGNTLSYNPTHIRVQDTPLSGGSCTVNNNTFVGGGSNVVLKNSNCN